MRLNRYADYGLRALMYLAVYPDERVTTDMLAEGYGISRAHLQKIVRQLGDIGVIDLYRGRDGGIELAMEPEEISVGEVLRELDQESVLVECLDPVRDECAISAICGLRDPLERAQEAFFAELDDITLADLMGKRRISKLRKVFGE